MEKKTWNQNLVDKYDDLMDQLYLTIADILKEKLGEEVIINYEGGQVISGKLNSVSIGGEFSISLDREGNAILNFPFSHMQMFPFYEGNNINMIADKDEW